jgi:hypothetical protein
MRHSVLVLAATILLGSVACHDVTAPAAPPPAAPPAPSRAVLAAPAVVVSPADMHGWTVEHDGPRGACADATRCGLVEGPGTPPLGTGSFMLTPTRSSSAVLALHALAGTRLDQVTALGYATYGLRDDAVVTLQLIVDYDLTDRSALDMGRLVYEPAKPHAGAWERWDARAGRWYGTREAVRVRGRMVVNPCTERDPCTWARLLRRFPDIGLHTVNGGLRLVAHRGPEVRAAVDAVVVGVDGGSTTYDFEARVPAAGPESLTVMTDAGVSGFPTDADTTYEHGAAVAYDFRAPADGQLLTTYLDGVPVPSSGTVTMNGRHFLYAALHTDLTLRAGDQPLVDAMRAVLAAPDPVPAFQSLMDLVGSTYATLDEDAAEASVDRAAAAAIDPARDADALRRVDAALGGHLFEIRDGGLGARATRSRTSGASRSVVAGNGTAEPTAIIYVNGVGNRYTDAAKTQAHLGWLLRRNVFQFRDPQDVVMRLMYNRNDATTNPAAGPRACFLAAQSPGDVPWILGYLTCRAMAVTSPVTSIIADLREAVGIMSGKELPAAGPVLADISTLADSIERYASDGRHVVLLPHSEGNLIAERALLQLQASAFLSRNAAPHCVAIAPMASPTIHYGPVDARYVRPVQLAGDAILLSPRVGSGAEVYPATPNAIDDRLSAQRAARTGTDALRFLRQLIDGGMIHSMSSYLSPDGGRDLVMTAAAEAYGRCATGPVTLAGPRDADFPQQYTMLLGSTAQYTASATNGAGDPVALTPVWSSEGSSVTVSDAGLLTAVSLGTGWLRVQIGLSPAELLVSPWSKPPIILSVSCTPGETRYEGQAMITTWTSTITAQPSTTYAPIASYVFKLEEKLRWSGADRFSSELFQQQSGNTATTTIVRSQTIQLDGTPEGGQWMPTGRCIGWVGDIWGKSAEQLSP